MIDLIADSNFILGLIDKKDKWNPISIQLRDALKDTGCTVIYFDCVITEVCSALGKRLEEKGRGQEFADLLSRLGELVPDEKITWIYPEIKSYFSEAKNLMRKYFGKLSFHDALIAMAAKEMGVEHIVSFDKDFDEIEWLIRIKDMSELKFESR